ncbi:MAG: ribonuclease HI [Chloroflexi bacterium HGW-Chloroflexi-3]|nr:MAG: ribonuclease HI [Chloroflexi bacterium HGW-Chloroflexi-3]
MPNPSLTPINIYTDGACTGNPGPGGYGVIIVQDGKRRELSQGYRLTTNNRMELLAAIMGLKSIPPGARVRLFTDSKYLSDAINLGWMDIWRAKNWKKTGKGKVLNLDLWKELVELLDRHQVELVWVKGHAGHPENERCDQLAVQAAQGRHLLTDYGYEISQEDNTQQPGLF